MSRDAQRSGAKAKERLEHALETQGGGLSEISLQDPSVPHVVARIPTGQPREEKCLEKPLRLTQKLRAAGSTRRPRR